MEWLADNPERGETVLMLVALGVTVALVVGGIIWLGRQKLFPVIAIASVWLLLAAIAIPSFIPARSQAYRNACINNLKRIREAKIAWANAGHNLPSDVPTEENLRSTSGTNGFLRHPLVCPRGGNYTIRAVGENPTCSLVGKGHKLE